jgi:hypothetical protein
MPGRETAFRAVVYCCAVAAWAVAVGSAAAFSGMAVCRVRGTPMIRGRRWRLSPVRIQVLGACGIWIVLAWFPPLALCVVTGDRLRRQDDEPVRHAPTDRGASATAVRRPCRRQMSTFAIRAALYRYTALVA